MVLVILAGIAAIETANVHVENMSELKQPVEGTRLRIPWVPNATNTARLKLLLHHQKAGEMAYQEVDNITGEIFNVIGPEEQAL